MTKMFDEDFSSHPSMSEVRPSHSVPHGTRASGPSDSMAAPMAAPMDGLSATGDWTCSARQYHSEAQAWHGEVSGGMAR